MISSESGLLDGGKPELPSAFVIANMTSMTFIGLQNVIISKLYFHYRISAIYENYWSVCLPVFCVRLWMTCLLTAFINFLRFSLCIWLRRKKSQVCPELPLHCTEPWLHFCLWLLRFKYWSESISSHFEFTGCQTSAATKRVMQFVFFCCMSFVFLLPAQKNFCS